MRRSDPAPTRGPRHTALGRAALGVLVLASTACAGGVFGGTGGASSVGPVDHAPPRVTEADYARAESFLGWNAASLVDGMVLDGGQERTLQPNWIDGHRFWYRVQRQGATRFLLVDASEGTSRPAFPHGQLAAAIARITGDSVTAGDLPFSTFSYVRGDSAGTPVVRTDSIRFILPPAILWTCATADSVACSFRPGARRPADEVASPDGRHVAFVRDNNVWIEETATGDSLQATPDGIHEYGYGTVPQECCDAVSAQRDPQPMRPYVAWSPDGRKLVMHRYDERGVADLHVLETAVGRPVLHTYAYALPGDSVVPAYELYVYDLDADTLVRLDADPMVDGFEAERLPIAWSRDSDELFFTRHTPDYKSYQLLRGDPKTGETRVVVTETDSTFVSLNHLFPLLPVNWRVIRDGSEVIWFSERTGWGHLYRYDAATGELLNAITGGDWLVLNVEWVDEAGGWVYFTGLGREPGRNPYLALLYRARLDGSAMEVVTPEGPGEEPTNHATQISPDGRYVLDTYSRRDLPGRSVLRRTEDGSVVMAVDSMDISRLQATGWPLPRPFTVKAADGVTDLHGYLHFPSNFDPGREYPVIDFIYPGPQIGPILSRSFSVQPWGDPIALAELGFIVFAVDARGSPQRSKAFNDFDYGRLADNGLEDHIAALRQLDSIIPQLDLDRVGVYGHSGGGAAAAAALLNHGDVFKVGVAGAGNHDNRSYYFAWGNKYQGLLDGDNYENQANQLFDGHVEGKLLITYGTLDDNVHPNSSLLLIDALIRNNENFDVLVMPNRNHFYMTEPYAIRRGWDYFVTHLLGATPPWEYEISPNPLLPGPDASPGAR